MRKTSSGFSTIILVVMLAVLAAVGFAGWYVWQQNHKDTKNNTPVKSSTPDKDSTSDKDNTAPATKYLVIKEWGVKIPLSSEIEGAYYTLDVQGDAQYARLYDAGFDNLKNSDGTSCGDEPFNMYVIGRATPQNASSMNQDGERYKSFSFTSDYLFSGLGAHQAAPNCQFLQNETQDENIGVAEHQKEAAFDAAFEGLIAQ